MEKTLLFLIIGLIGGALLSLTINSVIATSIQQISSEFNILIDSATGEIVSAGFADFANSAVDGLVQIRSVGDEIPSNITTDYYYDQSRQELVKRDVPIKPKYQRKSDEAKEKIKQDYLQLKTPEEKADFIAKYLKIID